MSAFISGPVCDVMQGQQQIQTQSLQRLLFPIASQFNFYQTAANFAKCRSCGLSQSAQTLWFASCPESCCPTHISKCGMAWFFEEKTFLCLMSLYFSFTFKDEYFIIGLCTFVPLAALPNVSWIKKQQPECFFGKNFTKKGYGTFLILSTIQDADLQVTSG